MQWETVFHARCGVNARALRTCFLLVAYVLVLVVTLAAGSVAADESVDFARDVAPLLQDRCIRCHQPTNDQGGLSFATIDDFADNEYVIPGEPDDSLLLEAITPSAPGERPSMPQEGEPLSDEQLALIRRWIAQGASWPEDQTIAGETKADASWWSLRPLVDVERTRCRWAPGGVGRQSNRSIRVRSPRGKGLDAVAASRSA